MPPNRFESEVESFLEGSHGDRTHIKRADHHTVTPLCGTLLKNETENLSASLPELADAHLRYRSAVEEIVTFETAIQEAKNVEQC